MEANIRVNVSGVSEAEQQLRNFNKAVSEVSRNAQQNVQGGSLNIDDIIEQVTQKVGGIDPFRSGRDFGKFNREVQENYISPLEQRKTLVSGELRGVESFKQTVSQQLKSGEITDEEYSKTLEELNKETEFYNDELKKVTDSLKNFGNILTEVGKVNQEILSGERDASQAPKGTRELGTLEALGLQRSRTEFQLQRTTDTAERNKLAMDSRESLKRVMDIRSEQMLTTNQRAVYNPAFEGGTNIARSVGGGVGGSFGEIVDTSMDFARDIREAFTLDLARSAGAVITAGANLTSSYAKMTIPKMMELENAQMETKNIGQISGDSALGLGMNLAETNRALQGQYRNIGVGNASLGVKAMGLESGAGVGVGGLGDLFQSFKFYSKDNQNLLNEVGQAISIISKSGMIEYDPQTLLGDFSRMQEASRLVSQVDSMQTGRFANVDVKRSASVVAGLEGLGGTFKGEAGMSKFQSIDESIRNPKNDFVKATLFRALMAENPNMSMIDLEKRMEAGAMGDGNLNAFIKQIGSQSGVDTERATSDEMLQNDMFVRNLKFGTGLNYADTEGLIRGGRSKGTGAFDIFDMKQGENISNGLISRGQSVGEITMLNKGLDNVLATQKGDMAKNSIRQMTQFAKDPEKFLADTISSIPTIIGNKLGEAFSGLGSIVKKAIFGDNETTKEKEPKVLEENTKATQEQTKAITEQTEAMKWFNKKLEENKTRKGIKE